MHLIRGSWWLAALAASGMVVPVPALSEDRPKPAKPAATAPQPPRVKDVALSERGEFSGRVVDDQGQALDGVEVKLVRGEKEVATTTADAQGRFRFANLKGGLYEVQTPKSRSAYRLWSADVAPAQAMKAVVVNGAGTPVVRGQLGFVDPLTLTAVGLGVAGVSLAGVAVYKLNGLEDDVSKIPTSP